MSEAAAPGPSGSATAEPEESSHDSSRLLLWIARRTTSAVVPTLLPTHLWAAPLRKAESQYLADNGVSERDRKLIFAATFRQSRMAYIGLLAAAVAVAWLEVTLVLPIRMPHVPLFLTGDVGSFLLGGFFAALLFWLLSLRTGSPRRRLLVSVARTARLVLLLDPRTEQQQWVGGVLRVYLAVPQVRRRRVAAVAWALTRDTAVLTGQDAASGMTAGEVLLWFAENPSDRRRRPILGAYLAELATAAAGGEPIPRAQFMPATRFRTRSPREPALRRLRSLAGGALTTGIVVAFVTAVLRLWFK